MTTPDTAISGLIERLRIAASNTMLQVDQSVMREAADALEALAQPAQSEPVAWRCFHCDEVFTDEHGARLHFGADESRTPACEIKGAEGGLVEALRRAENDAADAWFAIHNENTDAAKAYFAQNARHQEQLRAVEQVGYDRGIADAKAHPETLGLYVSPPPVPSGVRVTDEMVEAALHGRVPGGSSVWVWIAQDDAYKPSRTARDVVRAALEAALASIQPEPGK